MFTLDQIVPWGRSFDEYRRMFALTGADLNLRILGCADGPASFNADATRRGMRVVSCDPLYQWEAGQIRDRIATTYDQMLEQARCNREDFIWDRIRSVEELGQVRMAAMQTFLEDYNLGKSEGRYIPAELPVLPFAQGSFALAVCSHFLFLYADRLNEAFHLTAIEEICRVAREARIFPLIDLGGQPSSYMESIVERLRGSGYEVSIETVPYEFQRGGNQMMRVRRAWKVGR